MSNRRTTGFSYQELFEKHAKKSYESWVQPKSGDLLGDTKYLLNRITPGQDPRTRASFGRASLLLSIAAIEAITNDGLSTLHGFLGDQWPSECINDPPWTFFKRTSWKRVGGLLRKERIAKKLEYLLGHVKRVTNLDISDDLRPRLRQIFQIRNRIAHMTYLQDPDKYFSVFNDKQVAYTAKVAHETASEYINLLKEAFEEFHLPIETIRPDWWFEEQSSYPSKWSEFKKPSL